MSALAEYATVSIAFEVRSGLEVEDHTIAERPIAVPYVKDYDANNGPAKWREDFDVSNWALFTARSDGRLLGGSVVAFRTPGVTMLEDRDDLAVLWDLRVAPEARGAGIGSSLFRAAERWAAANECTQLKVETQNINAPACALYQRLGCILRRVDRTAYPDNPGEIQLLWYKDL